MISVIICGRTRKIPNELHRNIIDTIGTAHEICYIDNSSAVLSIYAAYNMGIQMSHGDCLAFIHDDITFLASGWGCIIQKTFKNSTIGALGVSGTRFLPNFPSSWFSFSDEKLKCLISHTVHNLSEYDKMKNPAMDDEVVSIDGVFMAFPRSIFNKVLFSENIFSGFHGYDLDICHQVRRLGKTILITSGIPILHRSKGTLNNDWLNTINMIYNHYRNELPAATLLVDQNTRNRANISGFLTLTRHSFFLRLKREYFRNWLQALVASNVIFSILTPYFWKQIRLFFTKRK